MRDFKAGRDIKVEGDVIITDTQNTEVKPLQLCNKDELITEKQHRQKLLNDERRQKSSITYLFFGVAGVFTLAIAIWYLIKGDFNFSMAISGILAVLVPFFMGLKHSDTTTEFEQRQLEALKEIEYLLKERLN